MLETTFVCESMREIVPAPAFATHTAPAPAATELGAEPTEIAFITEFVRGSIRDTEPSFWFATQTALPATRWQWGPTRPEWWP